MRYRVYRSLDKPSAFFGIRGRFMKVVAAVGAVGALAGIVIGAATSGLVGLLIFLAAGAGGYLYAQNLQEDMTERDLQRRLASRRQPRFITVRPLSAGEYITTNTHEPYGDER